jgi:hypothetical protein
LRAGDFIARAHPPLGAAGIQQRFVEKAATHARQADYLRQLLLRTELLSPIDPAVAS